MKQTVNLAIQVLPQSSTKHPYSIVDEAIKIIAASGLKYKVCPFETVIEGNWDEVMQVVEKVHTACYENETEKMMTYIKIQSQKDTHVTIEDKMKKYE